jgi:endonuclease-3
VAARARARRYRPEERRKATRVRERLAAAYPDARCALEHRDAYELLVATILSAQCTDERVNQVTPELFARWPTPAALARAEPAEVEEVIHSTGFFRNKTKSLLGAARRIEERFGGEVPSGMDDLLSLPGVARKTANVVRGVTWGLADGVVVDTHVARISQRLGWTRQEAPERIERDLVALHPRETWIDLSHRLIQHGRRVCLARRPRCPVCPVRDLCPSARP